MLKQLLGTVYLVLNLAFSPSQAEIPFNQAVGVYEGTRDEFKHISPFWGMVAIHGMLEQIRFFGNYEKVKKKVQRPGQDEAIETEVDKADDPIAQLIQELFPSPDGIQFVANTRDKDPVGGLSRNLSKINDLIGILLKDIKSTPQKQKIEQIKSLLKGEGNDNDITSFANLLIKAYHQAQGSLADPKKNPNKQLYPENIVIISLLGFFAKVADSKQDFAKLPLLMKDNFNQTSVFTKDDYKAKRDNLSAAMESVQNSPELLFLMAKGYDMYENPFMKPIQYRGDTCFKTSQGFPDCGETSLRNIFMMLLGKNGAISQDALVTLQSKINPLDGVDLNDPSIPFQKLITFFKNHPLLSDVATRKSHDAWAEIVSNLNRQEEIGSLEAIQYGRGEEDQTPIYEIKSNFSNIGVKGMINMLNVIAKIIPDKQLNEPWAMDETTRLQQASQKFTRFCELLSRETHEISWENKGSQDQTLSGPFGTLTFLINYNPAYDWRFIAGHFQIDRYASDVTDWRVTTYDTMPFPNEWLAFFYRPLNDSQAVEDDNYGNIQPLTFIYNSKLRSLDGALQTTSFVLYKAIMHNTFKQFVPLLARWIDISIPIDDEYAMSQLSLIFYKPAIQEIKTISNLLKNPKFAPVTKKIDYWHRQNHNNVISKMTQPDFPSSSLFLMIHSLDSEKEITLNLSHNPTITGSILNKINNLINLTSLYLAGNDKITDSNFQSLTNLRVLYLAGNDKITDEGLQNLPNLTSLNLRYNRTITNAGLQNLPSLTALDLGFNTKITAAGLKPLTNLTSLDLTENNTITNENLKLLTTLTSLSLQGNKTITDSGLQNLRNLTSLNLTFNETITDAGLQNLTNLTSLDLAGNNTITDAELQNLINLTFLNLAGNNTITDAGLQNLTNLTSLDLAGNDKITDAGLQNLTNLTSLNLQGNNTITDAGLQNLADLTSLDLSYNTTITDVGLQNLPNLISLDLSDNNTITDEFIRNHPHIQVIGRR